MHDSHLSTLSRHYMLALVRALVLLIFPLHAKRLLACHSYPAHRSKVHCVPVVPIKIRVINCLARSLPILTLMKIRRVQCSSPINGFSSCPYAASREHLPGLHLPTYCVALCVIWRIQRRNHQLPFHPFKRVIALLPESVTTRKSTARLQLMQTRLKQSISKTSI